MLAGIFVGGRSSRMGGRPKGLLERDGTTLVERSRIALVSAGFTPVLVGRQEAYAGLGLELIDDAPSGIGPLGGLVALLQRAGGAPVVALACDLPGVTTQLLERLRTAPDAPIVAPRREGRWEPLCARYGAPALAVALRHVAEGRHALQALLDAAGAVALAEEPGDRVALRDWDTPEDVTRG